MTQGVLTALRGGRSSRIPFWGDGTFFLADFPGRRPPRSGLDAWGVTWTPLPPDYVVGSGEPAESFPARHPFNDPAEVVSLPLPEAPPIPAFEQTGQAVIAQHPAGPWDRLLTLLGTEQGYLALGRAPGACAEALRNIARYHVCLAEAFLAAGAHAGFVADDYAGQAGPFMSPRSWRAVVLPAIASVLGVYRAAGAPVIFHTCGRAEPFIGELMDAGATAFNLQSELMDLPALRRRYGTRIAFYGSVATETMLHGTPAEVVEAVHSSVERLGRDGGLVLAPDQPLAYEQENVAAFLAAAQASATGES